MVPILPDGKVFKDEDIKQAIRNQLQDSAWDVLQLFRRTTQGWKNKPDFRGKFFENTKRIGVFVGPYGNTKATRVYRIVNQGAPPHRIPRNGFSMMRFREYYQAGTRPGRLISSEGFSHGRWRVAFAVAHPGIEPRAFDQTIADVYGPTFEKDMAKAVAKGAE